MDEVFGFCLHLIGLLSLLVWIDDLRVHKMYLRVKQIVSVRRRCAKNKEMIRMLCLAWVISVFFMAKCHIRYW